MFDVIIDFVGHILLYSLPAITLSKKTPLPIRIILLILQVVVSVGLIAGLILLITIMPFHDSSFLFFNLLVSAVLVIAAGFVLVYVVRLVKEFFSNDTSHSEL